MKHLTMGVRRSQLKITDHYDTEITFGGRVDFLVLFFGIKILCSHSKYSQGFSQDDYVQK